MFVSTEAYQKLYQLLSQKYSQMGIGFRVVLVKSAKQEKMVYLQFDRRRNDDEEIHNGEIVLFLSPDVKNCLENYELVVNQGESSGFQLNLRQ
jgi:hypothetical protein